MTQSPQEAVLLQPGPASSSLLPVGRRYWHAQAFADTLLAEFERSRRAHDETGMREHFYILATYYRRTVSILHSAFEHRREHLAVAAMQNLIVLQRTLSLMREMEPDISPSTLALETNLHYRVNQDLVYRILRDGRGALRLATIIRRFNDLDVIADAREPAIARALLNLVQTGHVIEHDGRYRVTKQPYLDANVDRMELNILFEPSLARYFTSAGFGGLSSILEFRDAFKEEFARQTGFSAETAAIAVACAEEMSASTRSIHGAHRWPHAELGSSAHPRPYQRLLHAIFRAHRYSGQVIEAPPGSGKTLVGMLCIEDWLRTMAPGHSVLVLVPTVSYQQQWVGELCIKPVGLQLSPHLVFAGTPGTIDSSRNKGIAPTILVLTYASLARLASGEARGGFDGDAIERFLQGNNVQHIILDEVHKVAADLSSPTTDMVRVFMRWLRDGSLASLIGFSGTVTSCAKQLESLGLSLASVVPNKELIAQGWVAPFAEFGAPFNHSERERRIASLVQDYRDLLRRYFALLDSARLRELFAAIPLEERVRIAAMFGMYGGRRDSASLIETRMRNWETGSDLRLSEVLLVSIVQIATGWPDETLMKETGGAVEGGVRIADFERIREALAGLFPPGPVRRRLLADGFGGTMDTRGLAPRTIRDAVATTVVGGYLAIRDWSRMAGEGRVSVVRSIIQAERREREVGGVIIFDTPAPLKWRDSSVTPGYRGAGGMFVELAGEGFCTPIAALSRELYLPDGGDDPLHAQIARWILDRIVIEEQGAALFDLLVVGSAVSESQVRVLRPEFDEAFQAYVSTLDDGRTAGITAFDDQLLRPLREFVHQSDLENRSRLIGWLSTSQHHLRASIASILDYAAIASAFREARPVRVTRGNGDEIGIRVVPTGHGTRRQRFLELTARLVDAEALGIDVVIVTSWARTGWNVLVPNVLIDATATRNVIAWQQLRGRAMRPHPQWSADAQRLVDRLIAKEADGADHEQDGASLATSFETLPAVQRQILEQAIGDDLDVEHGPSPMDTAVEVMLANNKVTHIFELVSAKGAQLQVQRGRASRAWERIPAIAEKHKREDAVRAIDGAWLPGAAHAPLIVAEDPRTDGHDAFEDRLGASLRNSDRRIIRGWLTAAHHPPPGVDDHLQ